MDWLARLMLEALKTRGSDDFADRLSSQYTVVILVSFAMFVGLNQYVGNPITCWIPTHFSEAHALYTVRYCWVKNTYYIPWSSELPPAEDDDDDLLPKTDPSHYAKRPYYQWIPFILLTQAVMFYVPTLVWNSLNSMAGIDAGSILEAAQKVARGTGETRDRIVMMMTKQFDHYLGSGREKGSQCGSGLECLLSSVLCKMCGRRARIYLLVLFLFSKVFYLCNVVGQLFLLNSVLAMKYTFGIDWLRNLADSQFKDRTEEERLESYVAFPRVTLCDFRTRRLDLGTVLRRGVQCVLPINAYNEKIYAFLWFWMVFVAMAGAASLLQWIVRSLSGSDRRRFITNHLITGDRIAAKPGLKESQLVRKFTMDYLRQDGSFLLRFIAHNTDNITASELICSLWDLWKINFVAGSELSTAAPDSSNHIGTGIGAATIERDTANAVPLLKVARQP